MPDNEKERSAPPEIGPYVFPVILAVMGLWCLYDGWFSNDPDMQEHLLFNRVGSVVLLGWAIIDVVRMKRSDNSAKKETETIDSGDGKGPDDPQS